MADPETTSPQFGGCAIVSSVPGEDDALWTFTGGADAGEPRKFLVSDLIEAGLRTKLADTCQDTIVSKVVTDCVGDWREQLDDIRRRATAQDKINLMLQDGVFYECAPHAERLVSLGQISQYIFDINDDKRYDLLAISTSPEVTEAQAIAELLRAKLAAGSRELLDDGQFFLDYPQNSIAGVHLVERCKVSEANPKGEICVGLAEDGSGSIGGRSDTWNTGMLVGATRLGNFVDVCDAMAALWMARRAPAPNKS